MKGEGAVDRPRPSRRAAVAASALLAAVVYGLVILLSRFEKPVGFAFYGLAWLFSVHLGLWWLFSRLDRHLAERWPGPEHAARRVTVYAATGLVLGVLFFDLLYLAMRFYEGWILGGSRELSAAHLLTSSGLGTILAAAMGAVVLARGDMVRWLDAEAVVRELEAERATLELGALRRQLDPHFLFNSLNTLAALIPEDPRIAVAYVEELAELYRYLLRAGEAPTVALENEVESARSLAFLLGRRFEDAFAFELDLGEETGREQVRFEVVPLTLHTLIENAVKHNVLTRREPLVLRLERRGEGLRLSHRLQPKATPRPGSGIGLENLRRSYALLGRDDFEARSDEGRFTVHIPLLTPEADARRHHRR